MEILLNILNGDFNTRTLTDITTTSQLIICIMTALACGSFANGNKTKYHSSGCPSVHTWDIMPLKLKSLTTNQARASSAQISWCKTIASVAAAYKIMQIRFIIKDFLFFIFNLLKLFLKFVNFKTFSQCYRFIRRKNQFIF